jgi:hypothetical protein
MPARLTCLALASLLILGSAVCAQVRVRTETIKPPEAPSAPNNKPVEPNTVTPAPPPAAPAGPTPATPAVQTDLAALPAPVARMRTRILEAARTGDLNKVLTVMQSNETMPIFSFAEDKDPVAYWRASYPDSGGVEVLAILIGILETSFVRIEAGTPQEMYVWPYFALVPLDKLSHAQKVELFRIVTGPDFKEMQEAGSYGFFRLGIGPDGTWHFFVTGR